jgi:hypothetical protein
LGWPEEPDTFAPTLPVRLDEVHREPWNHVAAHVAGHLLQLARRFGTQERGAMPVTHDLTQEEIAQLVGAARETVNKTLSDFTHRGWVRLEGKSLLISDAERLSRRARYAPSSVHR